MLQFRSGYRAKTGYTGAGTLACLVGRPLLVVAAALAFLAGAGEARAAIGLSPCPGKSGVECGTVTVPLDRTGATGGTIALHVEVLPAAGTARGVMFLIAGGPGPGSGGAVGPRPGLQPPIDAVHVSRLHARRLRQSRDWPIGADRLPPAAEDGHRE